MDPKSCLVCKLVAASLLSFIADGGTNQCIYQIFKLGLGNQTIGQIIRERGRFEAFSEDLDHLTHVAFEPIIEDASFALKLPASLGFECPEL